MVLAGCSKLSWELSGSPARGHSLLPASGLHPVLQRVLLPVDDSDRVCAAPHGACSGFSIVFPDVLKKIQPSMSFDVGHACPNRLLVFAHPYEIDLVSAA